MLQVHGNPIWVLDYLHAYHLGGEAANISEVLSISFPEVFFPILSPFFYKMDRIHTQKKVSFLVKGMSIPFNTH